MPDEYRDSLDTYAKDDGRSDFITILTTKKLLLTKRVMRGAGGQPVIRDYDNARNFQQMNMVGVSSLSDVAGVLDHLIERQAVVVGRVTNSGGSRRLLYDDPKTGELATLAPAAHRWLPVDLDSVPCPVRLDPIADPEAAAAHVMGHYLPAEMHDRDVYWQLTSGAGIKPGIRMRLVFWLGRTLTCEEMKCWLGRFPYVDGTIYTPNQLIYFARPLFDGIADPVPRRSGIRSGLYRVVNPPDPIPTPSKVNGAARGKGSRGYAEWRQRIGDHTEGEGFHGPIKSAVGAYIATPGADLHWLRADLEEVIRAAPRDSAAHSDSYIEKQIRDLDELIPWTAAREDGKRPTVKIDVGELPRAGDEAEAALLRQDRNIYSFGGKLVTVNLSTIRTAGGGKDRAPRLSTLDVPALLDRLDLAARFVKWSATHERYAPCHCPKDIAERYLARDGRWSVPVLLGVVTAPTLRADGSILDKPGYDPQTGLLFDPLGVRFPLVPEKPTRQEALDALADLKNPIRLFPFVNAAARSVAYSSILTSVARPALGAAPLHAFDAPVAGTGKSKLADYSSIVATGHRAAAIGGGAGRNAEEELEKKLSAALLAGDSNILLDNVVTPIGGPLLCQMLTQHAVKLRPFGRLKNVTVPCIATVHATGNNLIIYDDATRRSLVARLDPKMEQPELREFDFDPLAIAMKDRVRLLTAALTVLRAWLSLEEKPAMPAPLGSFEEWSLTVRNALIWLGEADPVGTIEESRGRDPVLAGMRAMAKAWWRVLPWQSVTVRDLMAAALNEVPVTKDGREMIVRENPDLYDAINLVTAGRSDANKALGWWLRRNRDRVIIVDGARYQIEVDADGKYNLNALDERRLEF